jgi:hypothetical protein
MVHCWVDRAPRNPTRPRNWLDMLLNLIIKIIIKIHDQEGTSHDNSRDLSYGWVLLALGRVP